MVSFLFIPLMRSQYFVQLSVTCLRKLVCERKIKNRILTVLQKTIYEEQLKGLRIFFFETRSFDGFRVANWRHRAKELFTMTLEAMEGSSWWIKDEFLVWYKNLKTTLLTIRDVQWYNKLPEKIKHSMALRAQFSGRWLEKRNQRPGVMWRQVHAVGLIIKDDEEGFVTWRPLVWWK